MSLRRVSESIESLITSGRKMGAVQMKTSLRLKSFSVILIAILYTVTILHYANAAWVMLPNPSSTLKSEEERAKFISYPVLRIIHHYRTEVIPSYWPNHSCFYATSILRPNGLEQLRGGEPLFIFGIGYRGENKYSKSGVHDHMGNSGGVIWTGRYLVGKFIKGGLLESGAIKRGRSLNIYCLFCMSATKDAIGGSLILDILDSWNRNKFTKDIKPIAIRVIGIDGYALLDTKMEGRLPFVVVPWDEGKVHLGGLKGVEKQLDRYYPHDSALKTAYSNLFNNTMDMLEAARIISTNRNLNRYYKKLNDALYSSSGIIRRENSVFVKIIMTKDEKGNVKYLKYYQNHEGSKEYSTWEGLKSDYP